MWSVTTQSRTLPPSLPLSLSLSLSLSNIWLSLSASQISFASTSVTLSGKPNFFRTVPSDESLPPALATVMQFYGWRQVTIVTEREPQFLQLLPIFNSSLSQAGITVDYFIEGRSTAETIFVSLCISLWWMFDSNLVSKCPFVDLGIAEVADGVAT